MGSTGTGTDDEPKDRASRRRDQDSMNLMDQESLLKVQLDQLRIDHRALDEQITDLVMRGTDALTLNRLKKKKLLLKDKIARLEDKLYPDIIA